jgi:hypothetical protein
MSSGGAASTTPCLGGRRSQDATLGNRRGMACAAPPRHTPPQLPPNHSAGAGATHNRSSEGVGRFPPTHPPARAGWLTARRSAYYAEKF